MGFSGVVEAAVVGKPCPVLGERVCAFVFADERLLGGADGDVTQMPGVFLVFHGEILKSYRHQSSADRPDYVALVSEMNDKPATR